MRREGSEPDLSPISKGSHIDAILYSGKYDGVVGVLCAIEFINVLKRYIFKPKRSLEVIMFTSEEPTRYEISFLGSNGETTTLILCGSQKNALTDKYFLSFSIHYVIFLVNVLNIKIKSC